MQGARQQKSRLLRTNISIAFMVKLLRTIIFLLSVPFWLTCSTAPQPISPKQWAPVKGPENGHLVIAGGGKLDGTGILEKFVELAGGEKAEIVVIPTAGTDLYIGFPDREKQLRAMFLDRGAAMVEVLHTRDSSEADNTEFAVAVMTATGVWFTGGRQWRLVDAYANTVTLEAVRSVLARGGVVGGSSAGATIQGSYLVRGDTSGNTIMMGDHEKGFAFLTNSAIDQHLLRRNRQFDMYSVLAKHPSLLGIGLDEGTAIVVKGYQCEVVGKSYVAIYNGSLNSEKFPMLSQNDFRPFHLLREGDRFDLAKRTMIREETE
jgi:cyanophycinase